MEQVLEGKSTLAHEFSSIVEEQFNDSHTTSSVPGNVAEPTQIIAGKKNDDGSLELRMDSVARTDPAPDGTPGRLDIRKSKAKGKAMINKGTGVRLPPSSKQRKRRTRQQMGEHYALQGLKLSGMEDYGNAIKMNLLSRSGLVNNRVVRDLNILESSVKEAAHHLNADGLQPELDRHFGLDNLRQEALNKQADGCTIAALLMMNGAMLHQRIANGRWLSGVSTLENVKNDVNVVRRVSREWNQIMRHDFRPVLEPAVRAMETIEDTGKLAGLERALRHIAAEAERIAETYADMGADHAGPLFNRVMGNQASDGAFFTRPVAASIAARLTLDVCSAVDWTDPEVWKAHKTVDLACGSGTLLAAMLTDMKRRARDQGASESQIAKLQKLAVEETIKGLDINPVSLQLAASQLTAGNHEIRYRRMGLYQMPYGPYRYNSGNSMQSSSVHEETHSECRVGTLELLLHNEVVQKKDLLTPDICNNILDSQATWRSSDLADVEDVLDAAKNAFIIIMNPPFSSRKKMGEKFSKDIQNALRRRTDSVETTLTSSDPNLTEFSDKNSIEPLFVALADHLQKRSNGVLAMVNPTVALSATTAQEKRSILAQRYHIHSILTCHDSHNINLSQNTSINESIVILERRKGLKPPTRIINLDRFPVDERDIDDFHAQLTRCSLGLIEGGWGEVSHWPTERIAAADWTAAVFRSPKLAEAAARFAEEESLQSILQQGFSCHVTYPMMDKRYFIPAIQGDKGSFPIIDSKGADGQKTICSRPDSEWKPTNSDESESESHQKTQKLLSKSGYLLITTGQDTRTARLTAVAGFKKYVGRGWLPVTGPGVEESKSIAVFLNSTAGRLQFLRIAGRKLAFPNYNQSPLERICVPNVKDSHIVEILADCWERTKDMEVPQYRDGECEVRRLWDEAVAKAMGWDPDELERLRLLLHREPHVCGMGYNQYADAVENQPTDCQGFQELADRWEAETALLSNSERAAQHPAHQEIVTMGRGAVPLILERIRSQGGLWFHALSAITGANPVAPEDRGNVAAMQKSWLKWGEHNGYG